MEILDILNPDGTPAGYTAEKSEVHTKGLWHRVAHIWILDSENNVVLQRRSKNKENYPNVYDISVAGHISADESPAGGVMRELLEETGISFDGDNLVYIGSRPSSDTINNGAYINNEWVETYVLRSDINIETFIPQPSEVDHFIKIPFEELQQWIIEEKEDCICGGPKFEMLEQYLREK